jgi:hypothetical protein
MVSSLLSPDVEAFDGATSWEVERPTCFLAFFAPIVLIVGELGKVDR